MSNSSQDDAENYHDYSDDIRMSLDLFKPLVIGLLLLIVYGQVMIIKGQSKAPSAKSEESTCQVEWKLTSRESRLGYGKWVN